jgi:hypothetical protein
MPFPVRAIQIDGGSEFMAEFEAACQAKDVALYVLPPRSPQTNGAVKRCNGAWRYEFYETYDLPPTSANSTPSSRAASASTTTTAPMAPLAERPRPVSSQSLTLEIPALSDVLIPDIVLHSPYRCAISSPAAVTLSLRMRV